MCLFWERLIRYPRGIEKFFESYWMIRDMIEHSETLLSIRSDLGIRFNQKKYSKLIIPSAMKLTKRYEKDQTIDLIPETDTIREEILKAFK